jgi:hypothetical protein
LAPADFFLFPRLKYTLKDSQFQTTEENSLWDLRVPEVKGTMEAVYGLIKLKAYPYYLKREFGFFLDRPHMLVDFLLPIYSDNEIHA